MVSSSANVHAGLRPGGRLGDYQLIVPVGTGGMGRVWAARRCGAGPGAPLFAIKTGLGEGGGGPEFHRLFVDEARIASLIDHQNACGVYELGDQDGTLYLVMEWCDGATLRDVIDAAPDHRIPLEVAVRIIAEVAAGLHAAHELVDDDGEPMQVVHRDVSPQNVLLWSGGHVKVSDFGVAKARGQLHRPTETGEVKGKLSYMAPEQVTSPRIDRRADIFGLGCVLYEATVGRRPYHGGDALTTLYQLLERETVTPRSVVPDFPEDLEAIVLRALAKSPDARYATAEQLRAALEGWLRARRLIVTETQVAAVVRDTVGELITKKRQLVQDTVAQLDSDRSVVPSEAPSAGADTNEPTVRPIESGEPSVVSPGRPSLWSRRSRNDRWAVTGLAVGAVALAGVVVGLVAQRAPREPTSGPTSAVPVGTTGLGATADVAASAAPPAVREVVVMIRAEPADAKIQLDEETELPNPLVRRVPADGSLHVVIVTAPGHEPATRRVVYDEDRTLVVPLTPKAVPTSTVARPRPMPGGTGKTTSSTTTTATTTGGAVRPLDETNPFARPR